MKNLLQKSIMYLVLLFGTISCNDDANIRNEKNNIVSVRDGFLEFRDNAAYDQVMQELNGKSTEELDAWEKSLKGFVSMRSIYNRALQEELTFIESGGKPDTHSAFVLQNMRSLSFITDDDLQPNLPQFEKISPSLVNQFGIVKVGTSIFEYRNESIKEIRDADISKIGILKDITESDNERSISVINITVEYMTNDTGGRALKTTFSGEASCDGYTDGGGQRVKGAAAIGKYAMVDIWGNTPYPGQTVYKTVAGVAATNQIKRLGRWGNKNTAQLRIVGYVNAVPYATVAIDLDSDGEQTSSISQEIYNSGWVNTGWNPVLSINGALTFYGRDNSYCSI